MEIGNDTNMAEVPGQPGSKMPPMHQLSTLEMLPQEIYDNIALDLDIQDVVNLSKTCRTLSVKGGASNNML